MMPFLNQKAGRLSVSLLLLLLLLGGGLVGCVLVGCAPLARFATDTLNDQTGDALTLTVVAAEGVVIDPGDSDALGVILTVYADAFTGIPEVCEPVYEGGTTVIVYLTCGLGDIAQRTALHVRGVGVSASVTYRRRGQTRVFREQAYSG